jgi:predicted AlkP superfamily pyrophosphatase or phosphodiesterase
MDVRTWSLKRSAAVAAILVAVAHPRAADPPPKLAVMIVVDQMRADYVDRFRPDWTGGLKRLFAEGAWFTKAAYPYLTTVTCAGHATVATGAFPHVHGISQNTWWDRGSGSTTGCTDDAGAINIAYDGTANGRHSANRLLVPTFADEMRRQRSAHVVSVSLKERSAIMPAGHGGDAVTWLSTAVDGWATSSAFAGAPVPEVKAFVDANPIDADFGKAWTLLLPKERYPEPDAAEGEAPPNGWTPLFPHVLTGTTNKPDGDFHAQWERSPYGDAYLGRFAAALAASMRLGKHEGIDVLAVSFSSPDLIGHAFGPDSLEIHDTYARLDRTIDALLTRLDVLVGRGQYVVALTADHGVTPIPEQLKAAGRDGGRIDPATIVDAIERRARAALGPGMYVANVNTNDVYFAPEMYDRVATAPAVLAAVMKGIEEIPGIARVFRSEDLRDAAKAADPLMRAAALSYVPGRSGDLILAKKSGWMIATTGTTHGNATPEDQRVPIVFMGRGIRPGRYDRPVTPADIAPTLAVLCRIRLPKAEGQALRTAIR